MRNNSSIIDIIIESLQNLGLNVSALGAMLILLGTLFLLLVIICLASREFRLWYWKIDIQMDKLESIDNRLKGFEGGLYTLQNTQNAEEDVRVNGEIQAETLGFEDNEEVQISQGDTHYVGKSGKIYTEKELEEQIRE